jgi:uncharacterized membrane protein YhaH (DUF805 family)
MCFFYSKLLSKGCSEDDVDTYPKKALTHITTHITHIDRSHSNTTESHKMAMTVDAQAVEMYTFVRDGSDRDRSRQGNNQRVTGSSREEEDVENGTTNAEEGPRPNPSRRLQRVVREVLREHYLCFVLIWLLLVLALAIATFITFIEMLIVFRKHHADECDVPLDIFVWINIVTFFYHNTLHLCIQRWLGYDPSMYNSDDPIPEAVARYGERMLTSLIFPPTLLYV